MAKTELVLPAMGEGIIEATIIKWLVNEGDLVEEDQPLLEIATDKVDSEIPSPVKGVVIKIIVPEGGVPSIGDILAEIDTNSDAIQDDADPGQDDVKGLQKEVTTLQPDPHISASNSDSEGTTPENIGWDASGKHQDGKSGPARKDGKTSLPRQTPSGKFLTPLVRNIAIKEKLSPDELDMIKGSGDEGRINKEDVLKYLEKRNKENRSDTDTGISLTSGGTLNEAGNTVMQQGASPDGNKMIEMGRMRKLIAHHMVNSKQISAHVTSFIDADVTGIVNWREAIKSEFLTRENQKITYTPVFIEAAAKALRDYPMINVSVEGSTIILKKNINIGMAVALSEGTLIVPVIKNADEKSLTGLARSVNDLADRARKNKLLPGEITGGTFTITNFGTFRNTTGTPIINQPEVAILGIGAIIKKPVVLETSMGDVIAVRSMMTLSLSYDHRVVDGALGGMFLRRVAEYLEGFDKERKI